MIDSVSGNAQARWRSIKKIVEIVDADGTSSDESDHGGPDSDLDTLARHAKKGRSVELTALLHNIDSYNARVRPNGGKKSGRTPRPRIVADVARNRDVRLPLEGVALGKPKNFYEPVFLASLEAGHLELLNCRPDHVLPTLV